MAKIMIIDDEADFREIVKLTFERRGHRVTAAENGKKGLEILKKEEPDLILLDIQMPKLNGWETLAEMRKRGITERVPVMMFTIEELTFLKMLREDMEGLVGYIEKPIDIPRLVKTVEEKMAEAREIRETAELIRKSPEGDESLAKAYEAWGRARMIHERFVEKLEEMEKEATSKEKLARIANLKKGELNTIEYLRRKGEEILRLVGLEHLIAAKAE